MGVKELIDKYENVLKWIDPHNDYNQGSIKAIQMMLNDLKRINEVS
jgi:hypothetical protein